MNNTPDIRQAVINALPNLPDQVRAILQLRLGIDCEPCNLQETGDKFGLSRIEVRQLEARWIQKIVSEL